MCKHQPQDKFGSFHWAVKDQNSENVFRLVTFIISSSDEKNQFAIQTDYCNFTKKLFYVRHGEKDIKGMFAAIMNVMPIKSHVNL